MTAPSKYAAESPEKKPGGDIVIPGIAEDGVLFPIEKMEAHRTGQLHQAVSVFVFCGPLLLIQRRASSKYHCGLLWANTCCSHPHWGESLPRAAQRRLTEELGLNVPLMQAGEITYTADVGGNLVENERVQIFRGDVEDPSVEVVANPDEVCETRWLSLEALKHDMRDSPGAFAPWFHIYMNNWSQLEMS